MYATRLVMHLVLIGPTGSGKTALTQCIQTRREALGGRPPVHISSGAIARELAVTDTSTDLALRQGALAPEQAMRVAVRREIEAADIEHGSWILDGFPRTISQLICIQQWTAAMPVYVLLDVPTWVCIERLVKRGRTDDNPDAVARRLELYEELTRPMVEVLERGGVLHRLADWRPVEDMATEIESLFT